VDLNNEENMNSIRNKTRMCEWLLMSLLAYAVAAGMAEMLAYGESGLWPRMQVVLWKVGHLNLAAYLGYFLDRRAFCDRIEPHTHHMKHIRRAIIMVGAMLAFGLAL
jgi:putative exporter of polyketide antibiotics